jgi:hypothetical protein
MMQWRIHMWLYCIITEAAFANTPVNIINPLLELMELLM